MDLLGLIKQQLNADAISKIGEVIEETPEKAAAGLSSALPVILGGFIQKALNGNGASDILNLVKNDENGGFFDNILGSLSGSNASGLLTAGSGILCSLFGDKVGSLAGLVSKNTGLGEQSATSIFNLAGSLVLGAIGKQVQSGSLGATGLVDFLTSQVGFVKAALPAGIGSLLSFETHKPQVEAVEESKNVSGNILSWLLLAAILLVGLYFWKSCQNKNLGEINTGETEVVIDTTSLNLIEKTLPSGVALNFVETSIENELIAFIEDSTRAVDKTTWFNFRNLTFEHGSAVIDSTSEKEVDNIAEILKAYPNVHLNIGGYTDNTGSDEVNVKLSGERAANVRSGLVNRGILADRLASEGYGPKHPIADNNTEEGRAQNRRIAVRVTKK